MIDLDFLKQQATKKQTTLGNILREYYQHLFLSYLYRAKGSQHLFFKGGTALKLVFNSPRFSQDLDFTASSNSHLFENLLQEVLLSINQEGIENDLVESKPTSGGHLVIIRAKVYDEELQIQTEVSRHQQSSLRGEKILVNSDLVPVYTLQILETSLLIAEKLQALLTRQKPRDFFDLYIILRSQRLRPFVKLDSPQTQQIKRLIDKLALSGLQKELKQFLPASFWPIIKDLPQNLTKELNALAY